MAYRKARHIMAVVKQGSAAGPVKHSAAHPGFKAVAATIHGRNPGAILASAAQHASAAAKRANPRLIRVSGVKP